MPERPSSLAVLVAAGKGERLGQTCPKAFVELGGRSLLEWAAAAFDEAPSIDRLAVVVPAADLELARRLLARVRKPVALAAGGARRQDSVRAGLDQAGPTHDALVLVHDAARPFVEPGLIDAVAQAAAEHGAALPVLAVVDTLKRVRGGFVQATVERDELYGAQTPQGFRCGLLRRALELAAAQGAELTDECLAVERAGWPVRAVPGSTRNFKITTPADLEWARALVAAAGARA